MANIKSQKFTKALTNWIGLWLPLFMLANLPVLTDWLKNGSQVTIQDLILPEVLCFITSGMIALIFWRTFKNRRLSGLLGALFVTYLLALKFEPVFGLIVKVGSKIYPGLILSNTVVVQLSFIIIGIVLFAAGILTWLANRLMRAKSWSGDGAAKGIVVAVSVAFLLQFVPVLYRIVLEWPQFFYRPKSLAVQTSSETKPDIYYIVMDRYTNQSVLQNQFNFDNSEFINHLKSNDFSVDPNARSNYPYTTMSIASTLNANYNSDLVQKFGQSKAQTVEPYHYSIRYSSVIKQLKNLGYSYYHLGSWYEATNQTSLADRIFQPEGQLTLFGYTFTLDGFSKEHLNSSVYGKFVQHGILIGNFQLLHYNTLSEADATPYKFEILKKLADDQTGGRFIFAHILSPHDPYYFNADGSRSNYSGNNNSGLPVKQKYLNQIQYLNSQMEEVVDKIKEKSGNQAIIVLQSDEGPYPIQLNGENFNYKAVGDELGGGDMRTWSDQDLQMKYGILAAYHLPGVTTGDLAAGGDSVNIFRLIFNKYFHANLSYLPKCYYAYPNGRDNPFDFVNITEHLTGKINSNCSSDSSFK